ncbi:MAG: XdhC family protein, partial [Gemmatimonadota bacterium]|nr:XdhC family protein [Gemmatimonadota bacterium]
MHECHEKTLEYLRDGKSFVVATIIRSSGSTPRKIGTRMLVRPGGKIDFTLGGGPFEALAIEDAKQ